MWLSTTPVNPGLVCHYTPTQINEALEAQQQPDPAASTGGGGAGLAGGSGAGSTSPAPQQQPNEMVVDAESLLSLLPGAVLAVFFSASSSAQEIQNARTVHRDLLSHYKLEEGDLGAPPLLLLDLLSGGSMPFSVPGAAWRDSLEPSRD